MTTPRSTVGQSTSKPKLARRRSEFLTPNQVADLLLIAPVTVRLWARKGLLPSVTTPGGHRRFRTQDVDAFLARRRLLDHADPGAPSRILIIDDDPHFARYLSKLLSAHAPAVSVEIANGGFSAGIKCESLRPDVVTLDLYMPDMNGVEVCEMIRTQFGKTKPRIVALTAFPNDENTRRIIAAGADTCLAKSGPISVLLRELGVGRGIKR